MPKPITSAQGLLCLAALAAAPAWAQSPSVVYRCPGPPVLYTDALSPKEAQDRGCRTIEGTPVTVLQAPKPRPASGNPPAKGGDVKPGGADTKIDPGQQRSRDNDRRKVLEDELQQAEAKLAALQREFAGGSPERRGDERNYQKYLDRVAEMKASIARQESDVQAIRREISKLP